MTEKKSRKRNKSAKINKILNVTQKMIEEKGYFATTTNHIAQKVGVSIGLVYKYFPGGKADIVRAISQKEYEKIMDKNLILGLKPKDFPNLVKKIMTEYVLQHRKNKQLISAMEIVFLSNKNHPKNYTEFIDPFINQILIKIKHIFKEKEKSINKFDQKIKILLDLIDSIVHRHVIYTEIFESDEKLVVFLTDFILNFINQIISLK